MGQNLLPLEDPRMELTLRYRGDLLGAQSKNGLKSKQAVRLALSPQIGDFWGRDPRFNFHDLKSLRIARREKDAFILDPTPQRYADLHFRYDIRGVYYVPLLTAGMRADCSLSVRFHRPQDAGSIIYAGGDLDNRLKTLFDALRMPKDSSEVDPYEPMSNPGLDAERVFCLLEGDELITRLTIESKRLLGPPPRDADYANWVELEIDINIAPVGITDANTYLLYR
jgi:hypothetical protein